MKWITPSICPSWRLGYTVLGKRSCNYQRWSEEATVVNWKQVNGWLWLIDTAWWGGKPGWVAADPPACPCRACPPSHGKDIPWWLERGTTTNLMCWLDLQIPQISVQSSNCGMCRRRESDPRRPDHTGYRLKGSAANISVPDNTADLQGSSRSPCLHGSGLFLQEKWDQPNISLVVVKLCLIRVYLKMSDWISFCWFLWNQSNLAKLC